MNIFILKERKEGENRVAITPGVAASLIKLGHSVVVEKDAGVNSSFENLTYEKAGATCGSLLEFAQQCSVFLSVNCPTLEIIETLPTASVLIAFIYPNLNPNEFEALKQKSIHIFAMEAIPRISRAQSMDALSSQSNLAGYKAVILGADHMTKIFPLMMTAAGTVSPSRVLIYGAGVAGLQAIATAKRLGAIVEVTDVRPETKEQVESLGGKFIEVKSEEKALVEGGYAKEVSAEYLQKQKEAVEKSLFNADLVITTALVMGKKAPVLISKEQVEKMKYGAVIVDMAVEQGGNCELSQADLVINYNGVKIIGAKNLPSTLATNASELYAKNVYTLLQHLCDNQGFKWDKEEEITKGCLLHYAS